MAEKCGTHQKRFKSAFLWPNESGKNHQKIFALNPGKTMRGRDGLAESGPQFVGVGERSAAFPRIRGAADLGWGQRKQTLKRVPDFSINLS